MKNRDSKKVFIDKDRKVMDKFYELTEKDKFYVEDMIDELKKLIKADPDFFDSYLYAAHLFRKELKKEKEDRKLENEAFKRALRIVQNEKEKWPAEIPWGVLENRHIVRALGTGGNNYWKDGKIEKALEIFKKLLKSNLNDKIGARYPILAIRLGMSYEEYENKFWKTGVCRADIITNWFDDNSQKFPEEFKDWWKYLEETE